MLTFPREILEMKFSVLYTMRADMRPTQDLCVWNRKYNLVSQSSASALALNVLTTLELPFIHIAAGKEIFSVEPRNALTKEKWKNASDFKFCDLWIGFFQVSKCIICPKISPQHLHSRYMLSVLFPPNRLRNWSTEKLNPKSQRKFVPQLGLELRSTSGVFNEISYANISVIISSLAGSS